jgi:fumarate hydratase subunit beta
MKTIRTNESWHGVQPKEPISFSGELITARDATLKKIFENNAQEFLQGKIVYFCGPTPPPPGKIIGSCGPTTSSRMEPFLEPLGKAGVKALIGKGEFSEEAKKILQKYNISYFAAIGGTGALLSSTVVSAQIVLHGELGPEAVYRLEVKDFPVVFMS